MISFYILVLALIGSTFADEGSICRAEVRQSQSDYVASDILDPIGAVIKEIADRAPPYAYSSGDRSMINTDACWKESCGRGVGKPIHACPEDQDNDAGLCYKKCKDNYKGVGTVCWEHCKSGYTDTGAFCTRPGKIISSDNKKCPWYDVCGLTFSKGCSHCPDHEPKYHNDGCTCRYDPHTYAKDSYDRGVGNPMGCAKNEQYDAGLCYEYCRDGYSAVGPVCWNKCPTTMQSDHGAVCCISSTACKQFVKNVSLGTITAIAGAVVGGLSVVMSAGATTAALQAALGFVLYPCGNYS